MSNDTDEHGLTPRQWAQLRAARGEPDTSDLPETSDESWATARHGVFYRARKEAISLHLDMDVLDWLRRRGPDCQTEINRILRERMEAEARS